MEAGVDGATGADLRSLLAAAYFDDDESNVSGLGNVATGVSQAMVEAQTVQPPPRQPVTEQDVTSMDSPAFDVQNWMANRKHLPLDTLLMQRSVLESEVNMLNSEVQTLVHDNYSRFIAAADIIREMRSEFKGMSSDTSKLQEKTVHVSTSSEAVNDHLQKQRQKLAELNDLHTLLQQLQAIQQIPQELRSFVAQGDLGSAVHLYSRSQGLMKAFGHRGILRNVQREASIIMQGVQEKLGSLLQLEDSSADTVHASVQMLRLLGMLPETMRSHFLLGRKRRVETILEAAWNVMSYMSAAHPIAAQLGSSQDLLATVSGISREGSRPLGRDAGLCPPWEELSAAWGMDHDGASGCIPDLPVFVQRLNSYFLAYLIQSVQVYQSVFGGPREGFGKARPTTEASASSMDKHITVLARDAMRSYIAIVKTAVDLSGKLAASQTARLQDSLSEEIQVTLTKWSNKDPFQGDWGVSMLLDAVHSIQHELQGAHTKMVEVAIIDKSAELVEGAIRHEVGAAFAALEQLLLNKVEAMRRAIADDPDHESPRGMSQWSQHLALTLTHGCSSLLKSFKRLADDAELLAGWQDVFVDLLQAQLQHLFLSLIDHFLQLSGARPSAVDTTYNRLGSMARSASLVECKSDDSDGHPSLAKLSPSEYNISIPALHREANQSTGGHTTILLLACFCKDMQEKSVAVTVEEVARCIPLRGGTRGRSAPAFVATEVSRRLGRAAKLLLLTYVQQATHEPTLLLCDAMTEASFLSAQSVGRVRPFCSSLVASIQAVASNSASLLPVGQPLPPALQLSVTRGSSSRSSSITSAHTVDEPSTTGQAGSGTQDTLFQQRGILAMDDLQPNVHSLVVALCTHALQSFVEIVRCQRFSTHALGQLKVDIAWLRQALAMERLQPFFAEILASGDDSCDDSAAGNMHSVQHTTEA